MKLFKTLFGGRNTVTGRFSVAEVNCASCVARIEQAIHQLPGISSVKADLSNGQIAVEYEPDQVTIEQVKQQITAAGYTATESAS
jgi:copper chaperone CopZ